MTKLFNLDFHEAKFRVSKLSLFDLSEHQRDLLDATSYRVQSPVPVEIFELFVNALETRTTVQPQKKMQVRFPDRPKPFGLKISLGVFSSSKSFDPRTNHGSF
jgi:hypothetical protein